MTSKFAKITAAVLLTMGLSSVASAQSFCRTYTQNTVGGNISGNSSGLAYGPFSFKCSGYVSGTLQNLSNASLQLIIQQQSGSNWVAAPTSGSLPPGTYRYFIQNTSGITGSYSLSFSYPVF